MLRVLSPVSLKITSTKKKEQKERATQLKKGREEEKSNVCTLNEMVIFTLNLILSKNKTVRQKRFFWRQRFQKTGQEDLHPQ